MKCQSLRIFPVLGACVVLIFVMTGQPRASELLVGGATVSITPDQPVALAGQFNTRIAREIENPCMATALALESREAGKSMDQAIMVSCDLVAIRGTFQSELREKLAGQIQDFDLRKLFLVATHTHTGPVMAEGEYELPKEGVIQPAQYRQFLLTRLSDVVVQAWRNRQPGGVSWGLGHAVVGHNRRAVYEDGTSVMYGATDKPSFRNIEGYEDHAVEMLFFWDRAQKLQAVVINLACPSQEVEGRSSVNADFWYDVREALRKRHGEKLYVLGLPGAAGDQSPHLMFRKQAEERMLKLRGLTRTQEIARRIVSTVEDVASLVVKDIRWDVPFAHKVRDIELPVRKVTTEEVEQARTKIAELARKPNPTSADARRQRWHQAIVTRFESQDNQPFYAMELHALRLGDTALATNPFELFLDFGIQMKARSKAAQTLVVQLATSSGSYVPTEKAVKGGGYSAVPESNRVGPEGGQLLVERTIELINTMFE